jgi:hypothetical protein
VNLLRELKIPVFTGLQKSVGMLFFLLKIILPVSCLIVLMDYFQLQTYIARVFAPVMSLTGLPGEAAIALALGFFLNFYAAIGAITPLSLGAAEITTMAVILGICHELPIESAVCKHTGLPVTVAILLRLATAFVAGVLVHLLGYIIVGG